MLTAALSKKNGANPSACYCFNSICTANAAEQESYGNGYWLWFLKPMNSSWYTVDVTAELLWIRTFLCVKVLYALLN